MFGDIKWVLKPQVKRGNIILDLKTRKLFLKLFLTSVSPEKSPDHAMAFENNKFVNKKNKLRSFLHMTLSYLCV